MASPVERCRRLRWPVTTDRVAWRPPAAADVPELVRNVRDRRISDPTTIPHPYRRTDGLAFVRRNRALMVAGHGFNLLGFERTDGRLIGSVGLNLRAVDRPYPWAEVGYWIAVDDWGQGYAGEGLGLALELGFRDLGLRRIEAWVQGFNGASLRVLTRAGFREEGRARESVRYRGRTFDRVMVGLLRREYRPGKGARRGTTTTRRR